MMIFITWITGQTVLEEVSAVRLDVLRRSKRVLRLETYQGGNMITIKGDMENGND
jgi:hypothetical protein